jgi:hypothetical protein
MAETPRNPNVERVKDIPFDKDSVSPMPQFAPRARTAGVGSARAPLPTAGPGGPDGAEEYPGPQTTASGEHVEPGRQSAPGDRDR